jgi:transposase
VSVSYVVKARQRRDRLGETAARPQGSRTPRLLAGLHDAIVAHVWRHQDATLDELRARLRDAHGVSVNMGLMWNTLARLGLTLKKRPCMPPSRRVPTSPRLGAGGASCSPG